MVPNEFIEPVLQTRHTHVRMLYVVLGLLFVVFGALFLFVPSLSDGLGQLMNVQKPDMSEKDTVKSKVLQGKVYMSLAPLDSAGAAGPVGIYTYDMVTGELEALIPGTDSEVYMTSDIAPNGGDIALSIVDHEDGKARLYVGDIGLSDLEPVSVDDDVVIARSPAWSPDGAHVAYMALSAGGDPHSPSSWEVWMYEREAGTSSFVSSGAFPKFLPDGTLLLLREDGIHHMNAATGSDEIIVPNTEGAMGLDTKFDVSPDGTHIVMSTPSIGYMNILKVNSWQPFAVESLSNIPANTLWPVFSPDGQYIVAEEFDWLTGADGGNTPVNPRLTLFSLKEKARQHMIDLDQYESKKVFITDWK